MDLLDDHSCAGTGGGVAALDALTRACHVQRRAAAVGFDWPDISGVFAKVHEEIEEIRAALTLGDGNAACEELGDLLFSVVNLARFLDAEPATALHATTDRFARRFRRVAELVAQSGKTLQACTLQELDAAWDTAKRESTHA